MDADLLRRYRFHREHGGCVVGHSAEYALRAARTERLLDEAVDYDVVRIEWPWDDDYELGQIHGLSAEAEARKFESNEWSGPYGCVLCIEGEHAASLWGIVLNQRDLNDPYARVVIADLASEVEDEIRQALGDRLDAEQPSLI